MIKYEIDSAIVTVLGERYVFGEIVELDDDDITPTLKRLVAAGHIHVIDEDTDWLNASARDSFDALDDLDNDIDEEAD